MRKYFKKVGWQLCQLRESSIKQRKKNYNRQVLLRVRFKASLFQVTLLLLLFHMQSTEAWKYQGSTGSPGPLGRRRVV